MRFILTFCEAPFKQKKHIQDKSDPRNKIKPEKLKESETKRCFVYNYRSNKQSESPSHEPTFFVEIETSFQIINQSDRCRQTRI